MTEEEKWAAMLASDARYNGRFITGVFSTGIYCIPSCRARKPKRENVKFFANGEEAAKAGLRPCKKCRPDEFERGEDRQREALEHVVAMLRQKPISFGCVPDLADRLKIGPTKLFELVRVHYHTSPADLMTEARIDAAKNKLLTSQDGIAEIAYDVGFESLSAFNENFKRRTGQTPSEYRNLLSSDQAVLHLPPGYNVSVLRRVLVRDPGSLSETARGADVSLAFRTESGPTGVTLSFAESTVQVRVWKGDVPQAVGVVAHMIGLVQDPRSFEQQAAQAGFERLFAGRGGARILQTPSLFDGLLWVIIGQQINLPFAFKLRQRLFEAYGDPVGEGLYATPPAERLANLNPEDLVPMQYSRRKAEYIVGVAQKGEDWFKSLVDAPATRFAQTLEQVKGLGPWSVNYLMMRSLGFMDCVPYGDTGLQSGLRKLYDREGKFDRAETDRLLSPFAPYRSLATFHLWQSLKGEPL